MLLCRVFTGWSSARRLTSCGSATRPTLAPGSPWSISSDNCARCSAGLVLIRALETGFFQRCPGAAFFVWVKIKPQKKNAGCSPSFYLTGFHLWYLFLTHSRLKCARPRAFDRTPSDFRFSGYDPMWTPESCTATSR